MPCNALSACLLLKIAKDTKSMIQPLESPMKRYILSLFLFLSLFAQLQCFSESIIEEQNSFISSLEKIYIQPDQILIFDDGIYVNLDGDSFPIPVNQISFDADGLYINYAWHNDPPCGHTKYCNRCGGCSPRNVCQSRCKCR
jgi:hypothetical protein